MSERELRKQKIELAVILALIGVGLWVIFGYGIRMWDDDDFEIADPNAEAGEGYIAAVVLGAIVLLVSMYFQNF